MNSPVVAPALTIFGLPLPVLAAIVSAIFAIIAGVFGPLVQLVIGKRQARAAQTAADAAMLTARNAGAREIAKLRQQWINSVRDTLSEYHSILMSAHAPFPPEVNQKLSELGTRIDLLLNPDEEPSQALLNITDRLLETADIDARIALDPELIRAARAVLKTEWDRVRAELKGQD